MGLVNAAGAKERTLAEQLRAKAQASAGKMSAEKRAVMELAIEDLKNSEVPKTALKAGAAAPDFVLPDAAGKPFDSGKARKARALVVTFYRGDWCPTAACNSTLSRGPSPRSEAWARSSWRSPHSFPMRRSRPSRSSTSSS